LGIVSLCIWAFVLTLFANGNSLFNLMPPGGVPAGWQHKLSADRGCSHYDFSKPCNPLKSSSETISKGGGYSLSTITR
jgi:hypothetical protein